LAGQSVLNSSSATYTVVHGRYDRPLIGATMAMVSMSIFSVQDAIIKWLATDYWLIELLFFRSLVIVAILAIYLPIKNGRKAFHTTRYKDHFLRTFFNFTAFVSFYIAVTRMPLADATAIVLSAPLIMTALSGPLLGEAADLPRKVILFTGFVGVLIVIEPSAENVDWIGVGCALVGSFMFAMLALQTRKMSASESSELMVFFAALVFLVITGGMLLFRWDTPDLVSLLLMLGLGVVTLFAQYFIVSAYQYAAVHVIAPFEYITILWALCLGWLVFGEIPTLTVLSGAALIVFCGLTIVFIERRQSVHGKTSTPVCDRVSRKPTVHRP
jgi:S-adenosylmethionine uptake transporter